MWKLKLSEVSEKPWTHLTVDFIMKLPVVARKDAILVVCDRLSKIMHFIAITERISAEILARLFKDNVWKLYMLLESIMLDRRLQFVAKMTKELNRMLGIEMKLSTSYHPQTDGQMERINQELEQYLQFFIDHKQKNWPEWLLSAEFAINNKTHSTTKVSLFMANYRREMRMGVDLRRKGKMEKVIEFVEKMRKVQEEARAALARIQEEMKRQVDRGRKETEKWKVGEKVMLSMKDLVFKERPAKKLVDQYIGPCIIDEVVSTNMVKLQLPTSMRIHLVVNISQVVQYREQVGEQKKVELKLVEVEGVKGWEVENILNKKKERGVMKYLVRWKGFMTENDSWEREKNLKNVKELVEEFKGKMEVRR